MGQDKHQSYKSHDERNDVQAAPEAVIVALRAQGRSSGGFIVVLSRAARLTVHCSFHGQILVPAVLLLVRLVFFRHRICVVPRQVAFAGVGWRCP